MGRSEVIRVDYGEPVIPVDESVRFACIRADKLTERGLADRSLHSGRHQQVTVP